MQPYRRWWLRCPVILVTLTVFIVAQSKTVWVAGVLLVPVLVWYRIAKPRGGVDIRFVLVLIMLASAVLLAMLVLDPVRIWDKIAMSREGADLTTLTGRGQIWVVAINEWLHNPLFGYGPEIWGPVHRQRIGMQFAFSAHNQFLQSLSAAGVFGLVGLLTYLWILGRSALRVATATRGVSTALFLAILFRCMTETPLTLGTFFNGDFLTHLLLFMICMQGALHSSAKKTIPSRRLAFAAS
jgi:O-antigen ligase